jgi:hypothetical protein
MTRRPAADGDTGSTPSAPPSSARVALDRASSFRLTYIAIVVFLLLYLFTVKGLETYLQIHFERVVSESIEMGGPVQSVAARIKRKLDPDVIESPWVDPWGAQVSVAVMARDGRTFLYLDGHSPTLDTPRDREEMLRETQLLLPATGTVNVSMPHNSLLANAILVTYASLLFSTLFAYNRHIVALENRVIDEALEQRSAAARRTEEIEGEIAAIRRRVRTLEPDEQGLREQISKLQTQREALESQLATLGEQESELRGRAERATDLEQEGRALEELLEEASGDLEAKDAEIRELEKNLKRAIKGAGAPGGKARESETLGRRLRTLYQNLEIDDRAVEDIVALRDDATKLRVEECLKRLSEDVDSAGLRRKVGGLPNHLSIFELGFAGKRRIYYTKGKTRRYRVLVVGAKNSQDTDLVYLSKLPKDGHPD